MKYRYVKRLLDLILAPIGLIVLSPLMLVVALLIVKEDGFPFIFSQERIGYKGKRFVMYKFRSMVKDADKFLITNAVDLSYKDSNDPRVTRIGEFIRKTCIDELPQLVNVIKGDMSLVGPRCYTDYDACKLLDSRLDKTKPGMTGLWQISNRRWDLSVDEINALDMEYVNEMSFTLDLSIIFRTLMYVMKRGNR